MRREPIKIPVDDHIVLEGELSRPDAPSAAAVLCHPHPLYGGTMRSIVTSALFAALPRAGIACVRFNFRGVEGSTGTHDEGRGERDDALAALRVLEAAVPATTPITMCGWSFGAGVALGVTAPRIAGWVAIAPVLLTAESRPAAADDPRPKLVVLAEHDEFGAPDDVRAVTASWIATRDVVVPGATHFFVGRTDRVTELVIEQVTG